MSESDESVSTWDQERVQKIWDKAFEEIVAGKAGRVEDFQCYKDMVELLASVRAEAIGWTWAEACSQHDRGMDPRNYEVPMLYDRALEDLNPNRE